MLGSVWWRARAQGALGGAGGGQEEVTSASRAVFLVRWFKNSPSAREPPEASRPVPAAGRSCHQGFGLRHLQRLGPWLSLLSPRFLPAARLEPQERGAPLRYLSPGDRESRRRRALSRTSRVQRPDTLSFRLAPDSPYPALVVKSDTCEGGGSRGVETASPPAGRPPTHTPGHHFLGAPVRRTLWVFFFCFGFIT